MKAFFEKIAGAFRAVRGFTAKYIGEIVCGGIAVRQLIIGDWFGACISVVVGTAIFLVNYFRA